MRKHAYLIIAHNNEDILKLLLSSLDDERNDIYLHIDQKASFDGSDLHTSKSKLHVLETRLDARWGDFSLVEVEFALFETAYQTGYTYYHLLSGVDLPIQSQDYIHSYCEVHEGMLYIGFAQNVTERELRWRSQHYFLFASHFPSKSFWIRIPRALFARLQTAIGYRRIRCEVKKGCQWCSVTHEFVGYFLSQKEMLRRYFNHTYCPDELVMQTLCWNSRFKEQVYTYNDEFEGCKRYIKWVNGSLLPFTAEDIEKMKSSGKWFARKFDSCSIQIAKRLLEKQ